MSRLSIYDELLLRWNSRINLIGAGTISDRWRRHFADSAQLLSLLPDDARTLIDLGSGAGFPGLVIAAMREGGPAPLDITLVESDIRKCVFLHTVAREMGVDASIRNSRLDAVPEARQDVVVSRALAPLDKLLGYAEKFAGIGTACLFHKGAGVESELTAARRGWHIRLEQYPSLTDPEGWILEIREFERLHGQ